jgi:hypothetical protein
VFFDQILTIALALRQKDDAQSVVAICKIVASPDGKIKNKFIFFCS